MRYMLNRQVLLSLVLCVAIDAVAARAEQAFLTPVIADKNDKILGPVLRPDFVAPSVAIKFRRDEPRVAVFVDAAPYNGFPPADAGIFWLTKDCSGPAYINVTVPSYAGLDFPTDFRTFWYPSPAQTPSSHVAMSHHDTGKCKKQNIVHPLSVVAKSIYIPTLGFETPFHMDLVDTSASTSPTPSPYLIDSQNKVVGPILSFLSFGRDDDDFVVLRLRPSDTVVILAVKGGGLKASRTPPQSNLLYEANDCTGTPYIFRALIKQAWADPKDLKTIFYPGPPQINITVRSERYNSSCTKESSPFTTQAQSILSTTLEEQALMPPFSVKLR